MRVLVTGSRGKVGRALCPRLVEAGYEIRATDLGTPTWDRAAADEPQDYWQADLTDAGAAHALVAGCEVVVHTAAIPQPIHNPPHVVFGNNMLSTFNVLEAAIGAAVRQIRQLLERDRAGLHLRVSPVQARLPSDRRGAPRQTAGSVRDRQVVRRAAVRPSDRACGHPLHFDPPVLGPGRRELRAEPRAHRP